MFWLKKKKVFAGISEEEIWDLLNSAYERMTPEQGRVWEAIKIMPEKWQLMPWGKRSNGFWVVAIIGQKVIWYNDIEEGFNRSRYSKMGRIDEYWCNQDRLEFAVQQVINEIKDGYDSGYKCGSPKKVI